MHTKEYNGLEINFPGPDLHKDEIQSIMTDLHKLIEEIDNFPDRSLFFQNPKIFDGWLHLVKTIREIEVWGAPDDDTEWENRTETYVAYLLEMKSLYTHYCYLVKLYYDELRKLIDDYNRLRAGDCISADTLNALFVEYDPIELNDINLYLPTINTNSHDARYAVFKTLTEIYSILSTVMDSGLSIVIELNPSFEDFTFAIHNDLREWNYSFGSSMIKKMKEELNRHYKLHPTDHNTPELWGELLRADEDALKMAMRQQLTTCDDAKQEHWGEDMKKQMDENGDLMRLIYSSCYTEELFDLQKAEASQHFISLLTPDNLTMFYDIIVRRSLIQCEMFSELKKQYEEWLENDKEEQEQSTPDEPQAQLNYYAPKKNLQELLKQDWFKEVRTKEEYNAKWTDAFVNELMDSEWKDVIARDWAVTGVRNKRIQIKGYVMGLLRDEEVIKGSYDSIAKLSAVTDVSRRLSRYMSDGKKQPYATWVKNYVNEHQQ